MFHSFFLNNDYACLMWKQHSLLYYILHKFVVLYSFTSIARKDQKTKTTFLKNTSKFIDWVSLCQGFYVAW